MVKTRTAPDDSSFALLLVQLGFHAAARYAAALEPLGLEPRHAGLLRRLASNEGVSQQALGRLLGINATRMVFLVDDLEQLGLVERRKNPRDRRSHALFLTAKGRTALDQSAKAGHANEEQLGAGLTAAERKQLARLLTKVATEQGITIGGLPGPPPGRGPVRSDVVREVVR
ncbi:MAG: Transcriptional regulator, MarR family [Actinomycetia bacterium]|nr:Transcriptional regulator, MarR family [Actinomycetes bacterium]